MATISEDGDDDDHMDIAAIYFAQVDRAGRAGDAGNNGDADDEEEMTDGFATTEITTLFDLDQQVVIPAMPPPAPVAIAVPILPPTVLKVVLRFAPCANATTRKLA